MSKTTTRVLQVRLVLSSLPPHLELPVGVNHPLPPESRNWLFGLVENAHVVRMDVTQISPGEFEPALRWLADAGEAQRGLVDGRRLGVVHGADRWWFWFAGGFAGAM